MYDILILGGGPSGLTAGIYAARGGLRAIIIENKGIGGQAAITPEIENYPGIESVDGFSLTETMRKQAESFGVEFAFDTVLSAELSENVKTVKTQNGSFEGKYVILACGAQPKKTGLAREDELLGRGVSYCATCDGGFFRNKPVAVVGGGNTAVEDALYLERFASEVYLIHRRDELRASKILADRIKKSSVKLLWDSVVEELDGTPLSGIIIKNVKTNAVSSISVKGLFVAIGQTPSTALFEGITLDDSGYIVTDDRLETNIKGVYAAGDIRSKRLRQIVTACADGAVAVDSILSAEQ